MPIVDVELVGDAEVSEDISQLLADALGVALSARSGGTWVRLRQLDRSRYAESGGLACVAGVAVTAAILRDFWGYDARTDEHAVAERAVRAAAGES